MAEIPALPGCRAWGDTPDEAIDIISDLAVGFIRDGIMENTLPPMVNPVEPRESNTVYIHSFDKPGEYKVNWIEPTAVELIVPRWAEGKRSLI